MIRVNKSFVDTNADEESLPLIIRRVHPALGYVSDAWFTHGRKAYHVRVYAPHGEWVDIAIRRLVYYGLTFKNGEAGE
jgi:hypothetical protein